ncbi:MAG: O-methyltransferase [Christensenellales bacterium]
MDENSIRSFAKENYIPIVRKQTSELLIEKVKEINPLKILEIGTAIGYSGILMLKNSNASLVTLEKDEKMIKLARENFKQENLSNRVTIIEGDCKEFIDKMPEKFDFIFLDGPKSHYKDYINNLIEMLNKNGMIFCDNVLFQNMVLSNFEPPKKHRTIVRNLREFIRIIQENNKLNVQIIDVEDGVALIKKIN